MTKKKSTNFQSSVRQRPAPPAIRNRAASTTPPDSSSPGGGLSVQARLVQANTWRDQFNPLRGLNVARVVYLLECAQRGDFAELQWAYSFIERRDADLLAVVERRTSALCEMEWNICQVPEEEITNGTPQMAEAQAKALRTAYEQIDNLYEAIEHLSLATFRGFAHCQLQDGDDVVLPGQATHIEPLNQWNIARDGLNGDWYWNPEARSVVSSTLAPDNKLDLNYFVHRVWKRPINEIAFIKWIRQSLSQKDWDAFIEIYGLPGWIVIMPPNIPNGKEDEYKSAAESVAEGGSGSLPNGADVKCSDSPRGISPFRDHLAYLSEKLVLAGTGGLLTMLAQSGSGTLAGSAHMEAFNILARADARKISEIFQKQFDNHILNTRFAGQPKLAYFKLAPREQADIDGIVAHAASLSTAGYQVDPDQLADKTGYTLTLKPAAPAPSFINPAQRQVSSLANRKSTGRITNSRPGPSETANSALTTSAVDAAAKAIADDLQPIRKRLETIMQVEDEQLRNQALIQLQRDLPEMLKKINANPASAKVLEDTLAAAMLNGIEESAKGES